MCCCTNGIKLSNISKHFRKRLSSISKQLKIFLLTAFDDDDDNDHDDDDDDGDDDDDMMMMMMI